MHEFRSISAEQSQIPSIEAERLARQYEDLSFIPGAPHLADYREGKRHLYLSPKKGEVMKICASLNHEYICCSTHVLGTVSNCPYDCTYCFLQDYLTNTVTTVISDHQAIMAEIRRKTSKHPWRFYRIGNWELGDSLALEKETHHSTQLVKSFATLDNALLELKTKSDYVDSILNVEHNKHTVVSWTLNPQTVVRNEEFGTATLDRRLQAMERVVQAGYLVGIHFDPILYYPKWQEEYEDLIRWVFDVVSPEKVAWISIASLRFNPEMKEAIEYNYPASKITTAEMILASDNKVRYVKPLRIELYSHIYESLRKHASNIPFVYLCMERWDMWERVFGYTPTSIGHLDYLITRSLYERFPGLVHQRPELDLYDPPKLHTHKS